MLYPTIYPEITNQDVGVDNDLIYLGSAKDPDNDNSYDFYFYQAGQFWRNAFNERKYRIYSHIYMKYGVRHYNVERVSIDTLLNPENVKRNLRIRLGFELARQQGLVLLCSTQPFILLLPFIMFMI